MITNEVLRYLGIAFASSVLLIVLSKVIMQFLLRRPADYYLKEEYRQEELILNSAGFSITDEVETNPEGEVTEEHVHVETQIPRPEPEPAPGQVSMPVNEIKEPEPAKPESAREPEKSPAFEIPVFGTEPEPAPEPITIPMFEIPVSGTEPEPVPELITIPFPEPEKPQPEKPASGEIPAGVPLTKAGKPRKPSMSMKKDELAAIAEWKGIKLPPDATKAVILELIENAE